MTRKKRERKERRKAESGRPSRAGDDERYQYIIGVGGEEDWKEGRGSVHYITKNDGKKYLLVFTAPEKARDFGRANFDRPASHMDMLESVSLSHAQPLTEGRYVIMPVEVETLAKVAVDVGVDYLLRNPRPGSKQEIMPVPKAGA